MAYYRAVTQAAATPERIGVMLVNLGTPDSPSYFAVQRYLREFLGDRRVIDTSRLIWLPLLYGIILPFRPIRTVRNYRKIWMRGGSPLAVYSKRLATKVGAVLQARRGDEVRVALAMTYGNPSIASAVRSLAEQNVKKLLVLPLYPQYCSSTTGSVFDRTSQVLERWRWLPETRFVNDYYDDAGYIEALTSSIEEHWAKAGGRSHLLFSYHGIPAVYVQEGDPYQMQAETTTRLVVARLGLAKEDYSHCYQSRFGSVVWLQPYTEDTLKVLAKRGLRQLTVVSPSFAVDCLETLEEVAMEYRDKFLELGGEHLTLVPALNDDDRHVNVLTALIERQLAGWGVPAGAAPGGVLPGGALSSGAASGGTFPAGNPTSGASPAGAAASRAAACGALPDGAASGGLVAAGTSTVGVLSSGAAASRAAVRGALPDGAASGGLVAAGTSTVGVLSSGAAASRAAVRGALPDGAASGGLVAAGTSTVGVLSSGAAASRAAVRGALPDGAAPSGTFAAGTSTGGVLPAGVAAGGASPGGT